jgi:hypothetical protein
MKVWITKYAMSEGVYTLDVDAPNPHCPGMISHPTNRFRHFHNEGKDWHRTEESALARAEKMRSNKIASLKKQIEKLEKLQFCAREEGKQS